MAEREMPDQRQLLGWIFRDLTFIEGAAEATKLKCVLQRVNNIREKMNDLARVSGWKSKEVTDV